MANSVEIQINTTLLAVFLKSFGFLKPNVLLINNFLVLFLVFGPALVVTIILVFNTILKVDKN